MARNLALLLFVLCLGSVSTSAQRSDVQHDAREIRQLLGLDDSEEITLPAVPKLPPGTLKLYLSVGLEAPIRDFYRRAIDRWNRERAKELRAIELVDSYANANLVLLRYERPELAYLQTTTQVARIEVDDTHGGPRRTEVVPKSTTLRVVPSYGFLFVKAPTGLEVLSRYRSDVEAGGDVASQSYLWRTLLWNIGLDETSLRDW